MSTFKMVFVAPVPNASRGANMFAIQPSKAMAPIALQAKTIEDARSEAADIWNRVAHTRFMDPDGYWIVDADDKVVGHEERDETATPRSPADLARIEAFKQALVSAGGGLVLPEQPDEEIDHEFVDMLGDADLTHDCDDFIPLADLVANYRLREAIAMHPVARDPAQLTHALAFMAGGGHADRGTVGDLQRGWLAAANNLAAMAQAGLLVSTTAVQPAVMRAA